MRIMKRLPILIFFVVAAFSAWAYSEAKENTHEKDSLAEPKAQQEKIQWMSIQEALDQNHEAKPKNKKKIFIDVYTSWCGWCKVMDKKTFTDPKVIEYMNDNFLPVKLDAESSKEVIYKGQKGTYRDFARSLGVRGYPTTVYMDEELNVLQVRSGYLTPDKLMPILKKMADK